jgi:hypothetical protein
MYFLLTIRLYLSLLVELLIECMSFLDNCIVKLGNAICRRLHKLAKLIPVPHQLCLIFVIWNIFTGADPGFQVRGAHLKQLHRAEGAAKMFGVFRVKNPDFNIIYMHI